MSSDINASLAIRPGHTAGIAAMLAATSLFAGMDATVKLLMADHSLVQVLFFRALFGLVPLAPLLWRDGSRAVATRRPLAHMVRSVIGLGAVGCFFMAVHRLPLAQVTVIGFAAPLLTTALAVPLLKERVSPGRWLAVAAGFGGVLLVAGPAAWPGGSGDGGTGEGAAFAVAGTLLYALMMVLLRDMGRTETAVSTVFWFSALTLPLTGAARPFAWRAPDAAAWGLFAAAGILGGVGQLAISRALRLAPASVVAPFDYFHIVVSASLGWLLFAEVPGPGTLAGAAVVAGAGLYVIRAEKASRLSG